MTKEKTNLPKVPEQNLIEINNEAEFYNNFLSRLITSGDGPNTKLIFRGHSNKEYKLIPSFFRNKKIRKTLHTFKGSKNQNYYGSQLAARTFENHMLKSFMEALDSCDIEIQELNFKVDMYSGNMKYQKQFHDWDLKKGSVLKKFPTKNILTLSMLAQHHGITTSLLDWSKDYLVALFFAISNQKNKDFSVWSFDLSYIKDSELINKTSNHSLTNNQKKELMKKYGKIQLANPLYHLTPNLKAQRGIFTYVKYLPKEDGNICFNLEKRYDCVNSLTKYTFNKDLRDFIEDYLHLHNIHIGTMFPGLNSVTKITKKIFYDAGGFEI